MYQPDRTGHPLPAWLHVPTNPIPIPPTPPQTATRFHLHLPHLPHTSTAHVPQHAPKRVRLTFTREGSNVISQCFRIKKLGTLGSEVTAPGLHTTTRVLYLTRPQRSASQPASSAVDQTSPQSSHRIARYQRNLPPNIQCALTTRRYFPDGTNKSKLFGFSFSFRQLILLLLFNYLI